jgi:hypothetical protein
MARRKGKRAMQVQRLNSIGATDIRRQRGEVVTEDVEVFDAGRRTVLRVDRVQDYLVRYAGQRHISDTQRRAGQRYARDCEACHLGVKSQLGRTAASDKDASLASLGYGRGFGASRAERRIIEADRSLGVLASIVRWVAADGRSAHDWAVEQGKPPRDGIAALRLGLDALALHYGMDKHPIHGDGPRSTTTD